MLLLLFLLLLFLLLLLSNLLSLKIPEQRQDLNHEKSFPFVLLITSLIQQQVFKLLCSVVHALYQWFLSKKKYTNLVSWCKLWYEREQIWDWTILNQTGSSGIHVWVPFTSHTVQDPLRIPTPMSNFSVGISTSQSRRMSYRGGRGGETSPLI